MKENVLNNLADLTEVIHLALERRDLNINQREFYLGRLAMCARLFKVIQLDQSAQELNQILKIEVACYRFYMPNDEVGKLVKLAWEQVSPIFQTYSEHII